MLHSYWFSQLNLLFVDVLVAAVAVVCLSSPLVIKM